MAVVCCLCESKYGSRQPPAQPLSRGRQMRKPSHENKHEKKRPESNRTTSRGRTRHQTSRVRNFGGKKTTGAERQVQAERQTSQTRNYRQASGKNGQTSHENRHRQTSQATKYRQGKRRNRAMKTRASRNDESSLTAKCRKEADKQETANQTTRPSKTTRICRKLQEPSNRSV